MERLVQLALRLSGFQPEWRRVKVVRESQRACGLGIHVLAAFSLVVLAGCGPESAHVDPDLLREEDVPAIPPNPGWRLWGDAPAGELRVLRRGDPSARELVEVVSGGEERFETSYTGRVLPAVVALSIMEGSPRPGPTDKQVAALATQIAATGRALWRAHKAWSECLVRIRRQRDSSDSVNEGELADQLQDGWRTWFNARQRATQELWPHIEEVLSPDRELAVFPTYEWVDVEMELKYYLQ